jgi:hypothetical protein
MTSRAKLTTVLAAISQKDVALPAFLDRRITASR